MPSLAKKILKGTLYLSGSNIFVKALSFLSFALIVRNLTLVEYGQVILALAIMAPIQSIPAMGLSQIIISDIAKYRGEKKSQAVKALIFDYTRLNLFLGIFLIVLTWIFCSFLEKHYGIALREYFFLLAPLAFMGICRNLLEIIFSSHERFDHLSFIQAQGAVVKLISIGLILRFVGSLNVFLVFAIYLIAQTSVFLIGIPWSISILGHLKSISSQDKFILWKTWRQHGKWGSFRLIVEQLTSSLKPWVLNFILGIESVAIFTMGRELYAVLTKVFPIQRVIFPIISRKIKEIKITLRMIYKSQKCLLWLNTPMFFLAFFIGPFFINWFFPQYSSSVPVFQIFLLLIFLNVFRLGQSSLFFAFRQQKIISYIYFLKIFLFFLFLIPFSFWWGVKGAAFAAVSVVLIAILAEEYFLRKLYHISSWDFKEFTMIDEYDKQLFSEILGKIKKTIFQI